ncbi:hypothetical protein N4G62_01690 [Sphingomonas sanguinis]|uniref:DUF3617 family protein n=1 Tax=Sphingomonas sanguinis TaxID=33051 RepID=A0ABU5LLD5_9SPHN|nr:hypothetical protein [Sphingomonas sanguinis]MDZ7280738.1 hypothetical protein [Sphingomonas sanguinis]
MIRPGIALATLLLLTACGWGSGGGDDKAGEKLETASIAAGLVADPAAAPLDGIWSRDTDRMCILPAGSGPARRVGVMLDYGEGQGCTAIGTMERSGAALKLTLGACRFNARFDGDSIQFPAMLPSACNAFCTGRATLSALNVERISASVAEAQALRSPNGTMLCAD